MAGPWDTSRHVNPDMLRTLIALHSVSNDCHIKDEPRGALKENCTSQGRVMQYHVRFVGLGLVVAKKEYARVLFRKPGRTT